jgi:2-polyprenyl-3-methyl-5-hydroxy-6-metoxy-1,4-benzoquinol methylase
MADWRSQRCRGVGYARVSGASGCANHTKPDGKLNHRWGTSQMRRDGLSARDPLPNHDAEGQDAASFAAEHELELGVPSLLWGPGQARRVRLIEKQIPLAGRRILDIGCGVGQYVAHLRSLPATVVGIDIDPGRLGDAGVAGLLAADAEHLPFAPHSFDVVILNEVIEHMADPRAALREIAVQLSARGHVVIYAPNRWFPFETHGVRWRGRYRFGNFPFVNWLPRTVRDRLVPHADVYTRLTECGRRAPCIRPSTACAHETRYSAARCKPPCIARSGPRCAGWG